MFRAESSGPYRDAIDVFLPRLIALVKEIPLPRIEYKSQDIDFVIDSLSIQSASFIPDSVRVIQHNDLSLVQGYAAYAADYDGSLRIRVDGLRFNAESISYWVDKKSGLFPFEDEGLLDISFDNKGVSFDVELESASEDDRETFFVVKDVNVDISDLDYSISKNRSWLLWFGQSTVGGLIRKSLKSSLETQITVTPDPPPSSKPPVPTPFRLSAAAQAKRIEWKKKERKEPEPVRVRQMQDVRRTVRSV